MATQAAPGGPTHDPQRRGPDGPYPAHQHRRRFDLRADAGGAGARAPLLTTRPTGCRMRDGRVDGAARAGQGARRRRATTSRWATASASISRRSTWCCCARTRPSTSPISPRPISSSASIPKTLVVNDPTAVRNAPEKLFVTDFPDLMPPTLITRDKAEIEAFRERARRDRHEAALRQWRRRRFKVGARTEFRLALRSVRITFREPWVVQRFLPEVTEGDKRIILVDGVAAGAVNRVPARTTSAPTWCAAAPRSRPT